MNLATAVICLGHLKRREEHSSNFSKDTISAECEAKGESLFGALPVIFHSDAMMLEADSHWVGVGFGEFAQPVCMASVGIGTFVIAYIRMSRTPECC